ncbi:APC family permease [Aurantiacibacter zhengii]|uniref:APC family permease n=1 Tax=Aurantiacibacter zhengii TaxID=2307003 RepID=A0A418NUG8_9SPHN|nr:APC family permease [Aurantiacibacter zhengii]RIV87649.1 APC family permease [Aurantiacibacter zhengii]
MDDKPAALPRTVGFWGTALFPVNGMIGAGIFALPAGIYAAVGNFAPWMMLIGGICFLPLALCYGWMAARFDNSGGSMLYGAAAFGRFVGFQAGWARYASAIVTAAANTHVIITYLGALFPALQDPAITPWAAAFVIAVMTAINVYSMRASIGTLGTLTVIKLLPLAGLVIAGAIVGSSRGEVVLPQFSQIEAVILTTYYAFIGFEGVVEAAGEMKNPRRDVPRAIVTMVSGVTLFYVLIIWAYIALGADGADSENALATVAGDAVGTAGTIAIVIAASVSSAANNFASGVALPRLSFGMAEQGVLPRWFGRVHPRFGTPSNAILFYGAAAIGFGLWEGFAALAVAGTLVRLITYMITTLALPVLEKRDGRVVPLHMVCVVIAVAGTLFVGSFAPLQAWVVLAGIVTVGTLFYFIAARERPLAEPA